MDKKPSQPGLPPTGETATSGTYSAPQSQPRPKRTLSASAVFSQQAEEIRAVRSNTGTMAIQRILVVQLEVDPSILEFPEETRATWAELIADLMIAAKSAVESGSPVDFHVKLRELKDAEDQRPTTQKLLFLLRLASWLSGKTFTCKNGSLTSTWKVMVCTGKDLESAAPTLTARNEETGEMQQLQLVQVIGGIKIF